MKVALIKCPWWVRYCPPYILAYFSNLLRKNGHEPLCFDLNNLLYHASAAKYKKYWDDRDYYSIWENESFTEQLARDIKLEVFGKRILASGARVLCFDTHTPSVLVSLRLAKMIKDMDNSRIIVFMGHKASRAQMAYDFIQNPNIDYVCPGEADISLPKLLKLLAKQNNSSHRPPVKGFLVKRPDGRIEDCGQAPPVKNIDSLPIPDYRDFRKDIREKLYSQPNRLDILDSRGCVNACHFCYERLYWQKYRVMSGKRLFKEISTHIKHFPQINYFYFNGLLLNGNLKVLEEFCDLVIASGLKINWAGQAVVRADMSAELLTKMARAGCNWLGYGIESGSQRVLDLIHKTYPVAHVKRVLKDTHDAGISVQINIMFGAPGETRRDFRHTLALLKQVRPYVDNVLASQSLFTLEKETFLRKHYRKFGIQNPDHHLFWKAAGGRNNYAERFRRYEEFCKTALALGLPETSGVLRVKPDKWFLLGQYYMYEKQYKEAADCFTKSLKTESDNASVRALMKQSLKLYKDSPRKRWKLPI